MNFKNCLIVFRNKKVNDFGPYDEIVRRFASDNIYFCRLAYCAFDDSDEIVRTLDSCKGCYGSVTLVCPAAMEDTLKDYTEKLFSGKFDDSGAMRTEKTDLFILRFEGGGKLSVSDISDILNKKYGQNVRKAYLRTVGADGRKINSAVEEAKNLCGECEFNVSGKFSDGVIEVVYPNSLSGEIFENVYRTLLKNLNDYVYAMENVPLAVRLFELLKLRRMKISVAESFTGGGISKRLVEIPGISEVYFEGLNTYSNDSKLSRLGVSGTTLKKCGAVSEETAFEMAEGLLKTGRCDLAVSTTGIAGPKSDSTLKPVGLVYIGAGTAESISVYKYELKGSREQITETAINLALFLAFKKIK